MQRYQRLPRPEQYHSSPQSRAGSAVAFTWRKKEVRLQTVLLRVKLEVAPARGIERLVSPALNNWPYLDQNLIGASHGG